MFRCPSCANVYRIELNKDKHLLSDKNMRHFHIIPVDFDASNLLKAFASMEEVSSFEEVMEKLGMDEETGVGRCKSCGGMHTMKEYHDAYKQPLLFFESEDLCGCGGELWMDRIPYSNRYGMVCDECNWVKPNYVVSGSANQEVI